ncbi:MAG: hypothetical protein AAB541_03390, partial [Patescibacteria group bacterium]
ERSTIAKVSETSPEYQRYLAESREMDDITELREHEIFGAREIDELDRWRTDLGDEEMWQNVPDMREHGAKKLRENIPELKKRVSEFLVKGRRYYPALQAEVDEFNEKTGGSVSIEELPQLPDEVFESFVRFHISNFKEQVVDFEAELESYRGRFLEQAKSVIEAGLLPISHELLERRMSHVALKAHNYLDSALDEIWGSYNDRDKVIRIVEKAPLEVRYHTFVHEMLHALSGVTILKKTHGEDEEDALSVDLSLGMEASYEPQRGGLHISGKPLDVVRHRGRFMILTQERFGWLNEAITEALTLELVDEKEGAYQSNRELLELIEGTMFGTVKDPRFLFVRAYFENYEPQDEYRIPAWKELNRAVNKAFGLEGVSGLAYIDKVVQASGVQMAINDVETHFIQTNSGRQSWLQHAASPKHIQDSK